MLSPRPELNERILPTSRAEQTRLIRGFPRVASPILVLAILIACGPRTRRQAPVDVPSPEATSSNQHNLGALSGALLGYAHRWDGEDAAGLMELMNGVFTDDKIGASWEQVASLATSRDPSRYFAALALAAHDRERAKLSTCVSSRARFPWIQGSQELSSCGRLPRCSRRSMQDAL